MEVRVQQSTLQKERRFPSRSELALADMRGPKLTDELPDFHAAVCWSTVLMQLV